MSLSYRRAEERDLAFVIDSWIDSYRTAHAAGLIVMGDWRTVMQRQLAQVLSRPGVEVWVAYAPGEDDPTADLYGWIAVEHDYQIPARTYETIGGKRCRVEQMVQAEEPLIHYCYVKSNYRREGIARGLFRAAAVEPEQPFFYTCKTGVVSDLRRKIPRARWQPLIARHPKT